MAEQLSHAALSQLMKEMRDLDKKPCEGIKVCGLLGSSLVNGACAVMGGFPLPPASPPCLRAAVDQAVFARSS